MLENNSKHETIEIWNIKITVLVQQLPDEIFTECGETFVTKGK